MQYNFFRLALFFFIYCFLGWCIESAIVSIQSRRLTNRGFLRGPVLPIYGVGALLIIFSTLPFDGNILLEYIVGMLVCTVLEYVTGVLMEAIFKTKYWDYSNCFMNFQGRICLKSSLFWGVLTLFVIHFIHDPMSAFISKHISMPAIIVLDSVFGAIMLTDLVFSAKAAFKLGKIVKALEEVSVQIELAKMEARNALSVKAEEIAARMDDMSDNFRDMGEEFSQRVAALRERKAESLKRADLSVRSLVRDNPTAHHTRFATGYDMLKSYAERKMKK